MANYQSPGVYVEEIPSGIQPIAGVSTSTAAFVGLAPTSAKIYSNPLTLDNVPVGQTLTMPSSIPSGLSNSVLDVRQIWAPAPDAGLMAPVPRGATGWKFDGSKVTLGGKYAQVPTVRVDYRVKAPYILQPGSRLPRSLVLEKKLAAWSASDKKLTAWNGQVFDLSVASPPAPQILMPDWPIDLFTPLTDPTTDVGAAVQDGNVTLDVTKVKAVATDFVLKASYVVLQDYTPLPLLTVKLCTGFNDFQHAFGGFSTAPEQSLLAHAVFGFFDNGGSRCYVVQAKDKAGLADALKRLEPVDEISIVAAPGLADKASWSALVSHCERLGDRFAVLDCPEDSDTGNVFGQPPAPAPDNSGYAAYYFPWIRVFDPPTQGADPDGDGTILVPPSGHLAGIYARVDSTRGVHKAPANEVIRGALGLQQTITKAQQAGLNPKGINAIRELNGAIRVWGARTLGGDANGEWKYINVRRLLLYIEESIDEGTQWVVFEPNDPGLWAKITRNVTAFLTNVWRSGALLGNKPEEAFYVKCDAETNPPEVRDLGQVVAEVGVAAVRPAEFVIFRISQWAGAGK